MQSSWPGWQSVRASTPRPNGWIFEDCTRGDLFENAATLRRNRCKARLLPLALAPLIARAPLLVVSLSVWIALHMPQV